MTTLRRLTLSRIVTSDWTLPAPTPAGLGDLQGEERYQAAFDRLQQGPTALGFDVQGFSREEVEEALG